MPPEATGRGAIQSLGGAALSLVSYAGGLSLLFGSAARWTLLGMFTRKGKLGWRAIAEQSVRVGVKSLPIVCLVQLFIGVILALQLNPPLAEWGQESAVAQIIGIGGFRMLGPILTAVVLSGFAGASIAAELGTMVVAEEIEAMNATALNPVRFLVVPRLLATLTMTVLLSVIADMMIALGGYLTSLALGPASYEGYWQRMQEQLKYRDFFSGLVMAGVFGVLIGLIACYEGLRVKGGAEGVGSATTATVVLSMVAIIAAACAFTLVFFVYGY